jgi:hypothetical protein
MPAQAGIHDFPATGTLAAKSWMPAIAGMTPTWQINE